MAKGKKPNRKAVPDQADEEAPVYHRPVLLTEAVAALQIRPDGVYVDCTFGGGGHAREILRQLGLNGRLIAFDQDPDAARQLPDDRRLTFVPHNFRHLQRLLRLHQAVAVDGILADLGVSSHQFDESDRGFSTRSDGGLDMRMDKRQSLTAAGIISTYGEKELQKIFEQYGEVTNARTLARTIVAARSRSPLTTGKGFKQAIQQVVKGNPNRYFAQVYQALRIEVNDELGALKDLLEALPAVLKPGGRAVIISFHSLEDRMVKNFFRKNSFAEDEDSNPFGRETAARTLQAITKKPIVPSPAEIRSNSRSRSALMRVAEKI